MKKKLNRVGTERMKKWKGMEEGFITKNAWQINIKTYYFINKK